MVLFDNWQSEQYTDQTYNAENKSTSSTRKKLNYGAIGAVFISILMGIILVAFTPRQIYEASVNINYLLALFPYFQQTSVTSNPNFNKYEPNYSNYVDQLTIRALLIVNIVGICLYAICCLIDIFLLFKNSMSVGFAIALTLLGLVSLSVTLSLIVLSPVMIVIPIFYVLSICVTLVLSWAVVKNK